MWPFKMGMSMLFAEQRFCIVVLLTLAFLFGDASLAFAQNVDILRLKDVKVGMKGFGKTVVLGRKIETFDVEVLGILANNKVNENVLINGKSILVKVSGEVIKRAGGIAAGMSGSPVYIDGKLMGGVSSGWIMTDHTVGLVTPIEEMLEIWSYPDMACADTDGNSAIKRWIPEAPLQLGGNPVSAILEAPFDIAAAIKPAAGEAVFRQASVDVYIEDSMAAPPMRSRQSCRRKTSLWPARVLCPPKKILTASNVRTAPPKLSSRVRLSAFSSPAAIST